MDKGKGVAQFLDAFRAARNREYCTEIKTVIITPPRTRSIFQSRMYPVLQRPTVVIDRPLLFQRPRITAYLSFRLGCPLLLACSANFKRADNILQETRSFSAPRPRVNRLPYDRGGQGGGSPSPDARRSSNKVDETDGSTVGDIYIYIFEICFKWLERYYILSSGGKITMVLFEMELVQVKNGMAGAIYNSQLRRSAVDLDDIRH